MVMVNVRVNIIVMVKVKVKVSVVLWLSKQIVLYEFDQEGERYDIIIGMKIGIIVEYTCVLACMSVGVSVRETLCVRECVSV